MDQEIQDYQPKSPKTGFVKALWGLGSTVIVLIVALFFSTNQCSDYKGQVDGLKYQVGSDVPSSSIQASTEEETAVNATDNTPFGNLVKENTMSLRWTKGIKDEQAIPYIKRFIETAQAEQKQYNIPTSITIAQGILESGSGTSRLATRVNNHFGIKCFSRNCKKGHCTNFEDDHHKDFFRNYKSAWQSYRDHSLFLNGSRYKHLQQYGTDYKAWAHGLKKAGYATDPNYAHKLIELIERFNLQVYDKI